MLNKGLTTAHAPTTHGSAAGPAQTRLQQSTTGAHEIGHTLGMTHTDTGIMSESQNEYRTDEVQQENLRQMLQSESGEIDIITKIFNMFLNESKK